MLKDEYLEGYQAGEKLLKDQTFRDAIRMTITKLNTKDGLDGFLDSMEDHTEDTLNEIIVKTKSQ